ncbi:PPOX class F420-dependent oxidoreductase [Yinghuangia sp. ASG 101]|uniref:PPOX class F420-dependent oxidoreductase n=1 Tax=Yinghuangia sp. ASG 101 TaxID=2896848 RepID=UPI001E5CE40F|nr:PPOX class F420-dependent oxidoreductase [Yinghuangia sp. ASG 101]UGQ11636.1 PPOX class F420-dependent oxidoreductase [Yinghuangia sp. ASG 101]
MFTTLDESTRRLLDGRNFATVSTLDADGGPQASVVWYQRDGDTVAFSSTEDRAKVRNLRRDPRVSITVFAMDNPYHSVELRGTAEIVPDPAKELPLALSFRYLGEAPPPEPDEIVRVIVRVTPTKVNRFAV